MSNLSIAPEFSELTAREAAELEGGIVFTAALLIPWMGKAFIAGVTLGAAAAGAYYSQQ
jgi:hypothetical protein